MRALEGRQQTLTFLVSLPSPPPPPPPPPHFPHSSFSLLIPQPLGCSGPRTDGTGSGHQALASRASCCPPLHFPWGLQEADLEWTTVKQSFLTEVEQLSR